MKQRIWGHILETAIRDLSSRNVSTAEERKIRTVILFLKPWIRFSCCFCCCYYCCLSRVNCFCPLQTNKRNKKFLVIRQQEAGNRSRHGSHSNSFDSHSSALWFQHTSQRTPCLTQTPHCHGQPCLCSKNLCFLECHQKKVCIWDRLPIDREGWQNHPQGQMWSRHLCSDGGTPFGRTRKSSAGAASISSLFGEGMMTEHHSNQAPCSHYK